MIDKIRQTVESLPAFGALAAAGEEEMRVTGLAGSLGPFVVAGLRALHQRQIIVAAMDDDAADRWKDDLALIIGPENVRHFSGPRAGGHTGEVSDIQALRALREFPTAVIVAPPRGFAACLPPPSEIAARTLQLAKGGRGDPGAMAAKLREFGFIQQDFVEAHGDYASRGGILDVYTFAGDNPVRVEFSGDEIESLREFDPLSQRSIRELEQATILPDLLKTGEGARPASLLDYAAPDALVLLEEPAMIRRALEDRAAAGDTGVFTFEAMQESVSLLPRIIVESIAQAPIDFRAQAQPSFNGSIAMLRRDLSALQEAGYTIIVTADSASEQARIKELLGAHQDPAPGEATAPGAPLDLAPLQFSVEALHGGFLLPDVRTALYTEHQVFNRLKRRGRKRQPRFAGLTDRELQTLRHGDYVVHRDFGIGRFDGMKRIRVGGAEQEVVRILYDAKDVLFVNLHYVTKLQKYASKEGHVPTLSRLGSGEWDRLKLRAKKKVKDIARELIALYARRKQAEGVAFSSDTPWQKELEAGFMYEDTFDQAKATLDVKKDMETPHPMDRLICGDVGFGKTEVAVRAVFKAIMDGRQAAVLVPTTILATQHYNTFRDRLGRFGVRIEVLSRFRSKKEQTAIAARLAAGEVDVVIGTHRLLSKDITFRNLGLLTIDEEHRFGVAAKEKLRQMRANVDTLSLTATPIPRTLHFSLMGARDLSIIATAPRNRLPIVTEILQWSDDVIRDAVMKELARGGQVYFVHDRVQTMDEVTLRLRRILPSLRIRSAHGQMTAHELENAMMAFLEKQCDVLVATKIIESGLDIPNVNTIFINRADRFGLAELYQLRGRVGRSNAQAYAYLLTPPVSTLPKQTLQRLQAVEEFTELGSGLNLAMRDLEIRGAGNLLGAEQSGFIENMGFETYTRILEEAVQELKDEEFQDLFPKEAREEKVETAVESDLDAFIPEAYVRGEADRLALYRRLFALSTQEQLQEVREEMEDRFGKFPAEIENLFGMVRLRLAAAACGFVKVSVRENLLEADFPPESHATFYESPFFQHLMTAISGMKKRGAALRQAGKTLKLTLRLDSFPPSLEKLEKSLLFLRELSGG
jgi:transcription-repair coupling factor (superfamily II helicase)